MDDPTLSGQAREAIADGSNMVAISAATVWELTIKRVAGRLEAPDDIVGAIALYRFEPLSITIQHAQAAGALPRQHGDPFDRMLVAQAQAESLTIVTRDPVFARYDVQVMAA